MATFSQLWREYQVYGACPGVEGGGGVFVGAQLRWRAVQGELEGML